MLAGVGILLTACQADLNIDIEFKDTGSGSVKFGVGMDNATLAEYPLLLSQVLTGDLEQGDWVLADPENSSPPNQIQTSKDFSQGSQLQQILDEISPGSFELEEVKRSREAGQNIIRIKGKLDPGVFRRNLVTNTGLDFEGLPPEAVSIKLSVQLGTEDDYSEVNWSVPLVSDEVLDFEHSYNAGEDTNRLWRWVSIAAFSLLGLAILINFVGWYYPYFKKISLSKKSRQKAKNVAEKSED